MKAVALRRALIVAALIPLAPAHAQAVVRGVVIDSLSGRPLAGALVQFVRDSLTETRSVESDSTGAYRIGLAPGRYIAGFFHLAADSLGFELLPRRVEIGVTGEQRLDFAIPSAKTIIANLCTTARSDSAGLLMGHVRDADTGLPRTGAVTVVWWELLIGNQSIRRDRRQIPAKTDGDGWFAMCGLPTDIDLTASAQAGTAASGVIEVRVPSGRLLIRDFRVSEADSVVNVFADSVKADSARRPIASLRRGLARLNGTVRTPKDQSVTSALVSVPGTGLEVQTAASGMFSLGGLPSGTQTLEVRALGYEPKRIPVELFRDRLTTVNVVLDRPVQTLDVVKVFGKGNARLAAFERRRRAGWGHVLTPADIERRHPLRLTDLFRTIPGVRVVPSGAFGNMILLRGCPPTVFLNGVRLGEGAAGDLDLLASTTEITAVEVYTASMRPAEFWGNSCGSVVLWAGMLPR